MDVKKNQTKDIRTDNKELTLSNINANLELWTSATTINTIEKWVKEYTVTKVGT